MSQIIPEFNPSIPPPALPLKPENLISKTLFPDQLLWKLVKGKTVLQYHLCYESAKEAAEARRIAEQHRASEQEREIRRNENLRSINEQRQQTLGARRQLVFEVVIPDFGDVTSGDEEEYFSDEDSDDESLIKIPKAATANGRLRQIRQLEHRRDTNRMITTDETIQWSEPERKCLKNKTLVVLV
uniref:Uncharacterized protein n=1 Tax=Meloidogyne javanica TaxID=6303 RepID=A0A915LH77_MELJA